MNVCLSVCWWHVGRNSWRCCWREAFWGKLSQERVGSAAALLVFETASIIREISLVEAPARSEDLWIIVGEITRIVFFPLFCCGLSTGVGLGTELESIHLLKWWSDYATYTLQFTQYTNSLRSLRVVFVGVLRSWRCFIYSTSISALPLS